jgi:amino acid permease
MNLFILIVWSLVLILNSIQAIMGEEPYWAQVILADTVIVFIAIGNMVS